MQPRHSWTRSRIPQQDEGDEKWSAEETVACFSYWFSPADGYYRLVFRTGLYMKRRFGRLFDSVGSLRESRRVEQIGASCSARPIYISTMLMYASSWIPSLHLVSSVIPTLRPPLPLLDYLSLGDSILGRSESNLFRAREPNNNLGDSPFSTNTPLTTAISFPTMYINIICWNQSRHVKKWNRSNARMRSLLQRRSECTRSFLSPRMANSKHSPRRRWSDSSVQCDCQRP